MEDYRVCQRVRVVDRDSPHHGQAGMVKIVTPLPTGTLYWIVVGRADPKVQRFGPGQLEAD